MKHAKKIMMGMFTLALLIGTVFSVSMPASAAGKLTFSKSAVFMVGDQPAFGVVNSKKSDKIIGLKSSNKKVVSVKSGTLEGEKHIFFNAKKAGKATVSFQVKRKNGQKYSFSTKVKVYSYEKPISYFKVGSEDYTKGFKTTNMVYAKQNAIGTLRVKAKNGYKITGIYLCECGTGKEKKIANGSKVSIDADHYVRVDYKNKAKKYQYDIVLLVE